MKILFHILSTVVLLALMLISEPAQAQTPDDGITTTVEYDPSSGGYYRITRVGDMVVGREYMTFEEYQQYQTDQLMRRYWHQRSSQGDTATDDGLLSRIPGFSEISKKVDGLLAIPDISINPTGSVDLTFQGVNTFRDDPQLDYRLRNQFHFDFDENIQVSMNAKIGDIFDSNTRAKKMTSSNSSRQRTSPSRSPPLSFRAASNFSASTLS